MEPDQAQVCTRCRTCKPLTNFSLNRGRPRKACRVCVREQNTRRQREVRKREPETHVKDIAAHFNRWFSAISKPWTGTW